jgi:hypothetical protein
MSSLFFGLAAPAVPGECSAAFKKPFSARARNCLILLSESARLERSVNR